MKTALTYISTFLIGALIMFFAKPYIWDTPEKIKVVKEIQYETVKKVDTNQITLQEAIGCIDSELLISHEITGNWMRVTAEDKCKKASKDIELEVLSTTDWRVVLVASSVALLVGAGVTVWALR